MYERSNRIAIEDDEETAAEASAPATDGVRPVSWDLHPTPDEVAELRRKLAEAGVREFPYPFKSVFAITSDIDLSNRRHFGGYVGQIVHEHGLDFGDSIWLQSNDLPEYPGLGFFDDHYQLRQRTSLRKLSVEMDHHELAREYHLGNIDHWHGSLVRGPRFVVLREVNDHGSGMIRISIPREPKREDPLHNVTPFPVCAIALICRAGSAVAVDSIVLNLRNGGTRGVSFDEAAADEPFAMQDAEDAHICYVPFSCPMTGPTEITHLREIDSIDVTLRQGARADIRHVLLFNITTRINLNRIRHLADRYGITFNLITIHANWIIPAYTLWRKQVEKLRKRLASPPEVLVSEYGYGEIGGVVISTNADDSCSLTRLYPELSDSYGTYYWRPTGNTLRSIPVRADGRGFQGSVLEAVTPAKRRDGGGIVIINTDKGENPNPTGNRAWDRRTMAAHFPDRLTWFLDTIRDGVMDFGILYTHLGNLTPKYEFKTPYFPENLFERLRRLCYGIGHSAQDGPRLWFARAGVLSDFATLLREIGSHIRRPDGNTIEIARWRDEVLGVDFPHAANQLFGQTFYVDDASRARVLLDGESIEDLIRNPPDDTGRPSVTVADCPIGLTLMRSLAPENTGLAQNDVMDGSFEWHGASGEQRAFLRLGSNSGRPSRVRLNASMLKPGGFQVLKLVHRQTSERATLGIVISTEDGGAFYFGPETLKKEAGTLTAWYPLENREVAGKDGWQTSIVPFYDLRWQVEAGEEVLRLPLPNRSIQSVELLAGGEGEADISEISFRRPKTIKNYYGEHVVIGGTLRDRVAGVVVRLERADGLGDEAVETLTDDVGGFCFPRCAPGGYRVTRTDTGEVRWVEAFEHRYDVIFEDAGCPPTDRAGFIGRIKSWLRREG